MRDAAPAQFFDRLVALVGAELPALDRFGREYVAAQLASTVWPVIRQMRGATDRTLHRLIMKRCRVCGAKVKPEENGLCRKCKAPR